MEVAAFGILILFFLLLGVGYLVANMYFSRVITSRLSTSNDQATMLAERYMIQMGMARTAVQRQNRQLRLLTEKLDLSGQELERLNDMKSKFLSMVVHDVRSPLASIKGFSQMLMRRMPGEKEVKMFGNILNSADQLNRLISDLTDLAMIEAGKLTVTPAPFDLRLIAADIVPGMQVRGAEKDITIFYSEGPAAVPVSGDRFRLGQVLMNLVTNALKFTPEGGNVTISVASEGSRAAVYVKDSGIGVHPSETKKIFEKFYQAKHQKDANLRKQGWGLGLSIAVEIIRAHKGEIAASSLGLGKGSTFYYRIPLLNQQ